MDELIIMIIAMLAVAFSLFAAGHALLYKRDSRSALGWVTICLILPVLGPLCYWCLGVNRISRKARRWSRDRRIVSGAELHPYDEKEVESDELPREFHYLRKMSTLGDRIVKTHLRPGNSIEPLSIAKDAYACMLDAIDRACSSICICSYIFDGDGVGADFVTRLKAASVRGVEVCIILDALGERYSRVKARKLLAGSGIKFRLYLPLSRGLFINLRNHRKLLIVDGREAFTGGMNIRNPQPPLQNGYEGGFRDMHFRVLGPVVSDLQRVFIEDWFFVTGERLDDGRFFPELEVCGEAFARCIGDGPDREFRKLEQIVMGALASARKSIHIMTPYFVPDRPMVAALVNAALRGTSVTVVLPAKNNLPYVHWATRALLGELIANGVKVYYQPPPFVHTKLMLMDDVWSLIGSANLDIRSLRLNFELNLTVFDRCLASMLKAHFDDVLAGAHLITLEELRNRPLAVKLLDNFVRLFTPYL